MPAAVVAVKSAGTFKRALAPKIMPDGFIKNRLELPPVTEIKPLIREGLPPTTRPSIFWIDGLVRKLAIWPSFKPNC